MKVSLKLMLKLVVLGLSINIGEAMIPAKGPGATPASGTPKPKREPNAKKESEKLPKGATAASEGVLDASKTEKKEPAELSAELSLEARLARIAVLKHSKTIRELCKETEYKNASDAVAHMNRICDDKEVQGLADGAKASKKTVIESVCGIIMSYSLCIDSTQDELHRLHEKVKTIPFFAEAKSIVLAIGQARSEINERGRFTIAMASGVRVEDESKTLTRDVEALNSELSLINRTLQDEKRLKAFTQMEIVVKALEAANGSLKDGKAATTIRVVKGKALLIAQGERAKALFVKAGELASVIEANLGEAEEE